MLPNVKWYEKILGGLNVLCAVGFVAMGRWWEAAMSAALASTLTLGVQNAIYEHERGER